MYSSGAFAWGNEGHQVTALIAQSVLNSSAKKKVNELIALEGYTSLDQVASWADAIKGVEPNLVRHTVRIPFDADTYASNRDCRRKGRCVVFGIEYYKNILADNQAPSSERLRALKFVVHFVGDVHQPLHAIQESGGMEVSIGRRKYTLHKIWDTIAIRYMKMSSRELASELIKKGPPLPRLRPEDWANESHRLAKVYIYGGQQLRAAGDVEIMLPKDYLRQISPIVKERLAAGGFRLGYLLNDTLGGRN